MKRVLIIDDDEVFRAYIQELLEISGYDVVSAANGREGIEAVEEAPPDLVITDLVMPEVEGLEVIRSLRRTNKDLPVIAVSGGNCGFGASYLKIAEKFGATAIFDKPFDVEEFMAVVEKNIAS